MAIIEDLPPELIDLILLNFRKREYALRACSLLSKSWRIATLPHLFSTFQPTLKGGELSPMHITTFLESHPNIAACVKHLWLRNWSTLYASLIRALLSRLPVLERLSLELTRFASTPMGLPPVEPLTDGRRSPPFKLQTVIINHCEIQDDPSHLLEILSLCEIDTFKTMFIRDTMGRAHPVSDAASSRRCIRIRNLRLGAQKRLHEPSPTGLLELLRGSMVPGCLLSMEFTCDSFESLVPTGALIRDVGENITKFKLNLLGLVLLEQVISPADRWDDLQLSSCTQLETFVLHAPYPYYLSGYTAQDSDSLSKSLFGTFADILLLLPPSVRTITLRLFGNIGTDLAQGQGDAAAAHTEAMEKAILEDKPRRFPELEAVVLEIESTYAVECATLAPKLLPRLHDSGLLRTTTT
ncbi:hypothetical protein L226DRAFT_535628 [Lentinus tigrinus ALCF2SS1-7]|uniref:F-box domain-containing protein n=1 Tax=Lentinus tigrinus ALCF2SS1-6 TaxID=1328759 RepID=A0A5C2RTJ6_9APHY|nr:hypothetical protein L227DRAFT_337310 [Lentinus tigrinus ALCF2SS1-6]RPD74158.1 hypothetical protein L226DRAFT_535628 [Lentinus tigrinus ALCF2SS1-7]